MFPRICIRRKTVAMMLLALFLLFLWWKTTRIEDRHDVRISTDSPLEAALKRKKLPPLMFYYVLPHVRNLSSEAVLDPEFPLKPKAEQNRSDPTIVIGIPTVVRAEVNYLRTTLDSLFENLKPEDAKITKIVVMIAEKDADREKKIESVTSEIGRHFQAQIEEGLLDVIVPPKEWYPPNLDNLTATFDDSPERMYWRTKQNLDHMYVMVYAHRFYGSSKYYLMLEDDVITAEGYILKILSFVNNMGRPWKVCHFTKFGSIGKLYKTIDLPVIYNCVLKHHAEKPVDWLLEECFKKEMWNPYGNRAVPALFQHVGRFSSLMGKKQNLRDSKMVNFRRATDPEKTATSGNPGLLYTDSSTNHGSGLLTDPYTSSGQFLLSDPHNGDFFLYHFDQNIRLFGLKVTLCLPLAKPLSVMVFRPLRHENGKRIKGEHEEILWMKTTITEMEYVTEKEEAMKISEVILEVASDAEPVCIEKIEVKFEL